MEVWRKMIEIEGKNIAMYENGIKNFEYNLFNSKIHGIGKFWYPNGKIFFVSQYKKDDLHGIDVVFDQKPNSPSIR